MIKEITKSCENFGEKLGVSVNLPRPSRKLLRMAATSNLIVGIVFVGAGFIFMSKWPVILGSLAFASSVIMHIESKSVDS